MNNGIPLLLDPNTLDYLVRVVQQRPWIEANPVLVEIQRQVSAQAAPAASPVLPPVGDDVPALP